MLPATHSRGNKRPSLHNSKRLSTSSQLSASNRLNTSSQLSASNQPSTSSRLSVSSPPSTSSRLSVSSPPSISSRLNVSSPPSTSNRPSTSSRHSASRQLSTSSRHNASRQLSTSRPNAGSSNSAVNKSSRPSADNRAVHSADSMPCPHGSRGATMATVVAAFPTTASVAILAVTTRSASTVITWWRADIHASSTAAFGSGCTTRGQWVGATTTTFTWTTRVTGITCTARCIPAFRFISEEHTSEL